MAIDPVVLSSLTAAVSGARVKPPECSNAARLAVAPMDGAESAFTAGHLSVAS